MKSAVTIAVVAGIAAVAVIAGIAVMNFSRLPQDNGNAHANETNATVVDLELVGVGTLDYDRSVKGPLSENQEFKLGQPVYITANLTNPDTSSHDFIIASEVRGPVGTAAGSHIRATIGGSGYVSVDVYWKPDQVGDYDVLVFQLPVEKLNRGPVMSPIAHIPIKVME